MVRFAVALSLCLLAWTTMSCAASQGFATAEATGPMPKYESVADPPGVLPTRILVEDGVLHFGSTHDQFKDLLASDIGFSLVFERIAGGIRARRYPILFPDDDQTSFEFDDYSCTVKTMMPSKEIICTSNRDGRSFRSLVKSGGLVEFELWCLDAIEKLCRYRVVGGQAIRPTKVQPAS